MTDDTAEMREFARRLFDRAKAQGEPDRPTDPAEGDAPDPTRAFLRSLFGEQ